jgi:RNA polymerase sigma-70 factor (ECF subfamily)
MTQEAMGDSMEQDLPRLRAFGACLLRGAGLDVDSNLGDILQNAVLAAFDRVAAFDDEAQRYRYICGELRNAVRGLRRQVRRFCQTDEFPEHSMCVATPLLSRAALRSELASVLGGLPPEQREPLLLRFVEDYDITEIAVCLGIPVGTAKWRLSRGLRNAAALRAVRAYFDVTGR